MEEDIERLRELINSESMSEDLGNAILEDRYFNKYEGLIWLHAKERGYKCISLISPMMAACYLRDVEISRM